MYQLYVNCLSICFNRVPSTIYSPFSYPERNAYCDLGDISECESYEDPLKTDIIEPEPEQMVSKCHSSRMIIENTRKLFDVIVILLYIFLVLLRFLIFHRLAN